MSENFYTILTATGKAKLANSAVLGSKVNFKTLKVGDGNGAYYEPTESQTSLVREVWSGNVSSISVDENNPNWIVAETLIPATIGGFFIREAGIFDEDGDLIAISKLSETYKPVVSEGSIKDLCIKIVLEVSNVSSVTLKIDPTVIVATRKDIDVLQAKMDASNAKTSEEIKELDSKLSEQISELANEISNKNVVTPAVGYGMNNVIKNVGKTSVSPKFTIQGKTVINLLGKDGNCEDASSSVWGVWQCTTTLDSSNKVFGSNSLKVVATNTTGNMTKNMLGVIDKTKYYCFSAYLKNFNITNGVCVALEASGDTYKNGNIVTDTTNFTRSFLKIQPTDIDNSTAILLHPVSFGGASTGQYAYVDGVMLEEITQAQYNDPNFQPSPYVENYTCLQNPYIEVRHDNLVRNGNGEEGIAWWNSWGSSLSFSNGYFTVADNDKTVSGNMWQSVFVKPNTTYTLSVIAKSDGTLPLAIGFNEYDEASNLLDKWIENSVDATTIDTSISMSITTNSKTRYLQIYLQGGKTKGDESKTGTGYFKQISMVEGAVVPSKYLTCRIERCVVEGKFTDGDSLALENGEVTGQINWKHKILFGKDYDWYCNADYNGFKNIVVDNLNSLAVQDSEKIIKYDGKILSHMNYGLVWSSTDCSTIGNSSRLGITVSDLDTGWAESINPNNDEVKAFMNGWKAVYYIGSRYSCWESILDNTPCPAHASTTISATSSGAVVPVADASKFAVNDVIAMYHASNGLIYDSTTITAINGNNVTIAQGTGWSAGDYMVKQDVNILNYCKNNVAPNYEGYQLHYKLQNPEPITDVNTHIHGEIPLFDIGDNYLYLDSGIVLGEIANPKIDDSNYYRINSKWINNSFLKNKTELLNVIYKNGIYDGLWSKGQNVDNGNTNGLGLATITSVNYDSSATYTVDYNILSTVAPKIGSFTCNYEQNIVTNINNLEEKINNRQVHDSTLDTLVDFSIYEKKVNCSLFNRASKCNNLPIIEYIVQFTPKKTVPIISLLNIGTSYSDGVSGYPISLCDIRFTVYILDKSTVKVTTTYLGNNTTIQNNLYNYGGWITFDIIADCRGRI
jgi:hypothetical protein